MSSPTLEDWLRILATAKGGPHYSLVELFLPSICFGKWFLSNHDQPVPSLIDRLDRSSDLVEARLLTPEELGVYEQALVLAGAQ